jgi:ADP-heptose:LPS heptosyltransferase
MKTSNQIQLDKRVIRPINKVLNLVVRFTGKLLNIDHSLHHPFQRIAIAKYKGMGSIIQATPLIQSLRENYPNARITFVTTEANIQLLKSIPAIDEVIALKDAQFFRFLVALPAFIAKLISRKFELYIDLEVYSNTSSLFTTLSMAKNRIGYYTRDSEYRMGLYTHMLFLNTQIPISKAYLQVAYLLGIKKPIQVLYPLKSASFKSLESSHGLKKRGYVVINPNASDLRLERRWPAEHFVSIMHWLRAHYGDLYLVLIGSASEAAYVREVMQPFGDDEKVISVAGKTSISELIALIQDCRFMLTNDTGPMHFAYSTQTPVIGLFGPCSPDQYQHPGKSIALYQPTYCSPCVHEFEKAPCFGDNACMQNISVNAVKKAINRILSGEFDQNQGFTIDYVSEEGKLYGLIKRHKKKGT